ncbi:recombinase family protein [Pseudovibrio ascidiaceicola]|uniref:recombinase family protein n=1 Tax=Pseudovibrio ascidiaceicola TaxID=285279 RepID=UPI003D3631CA
MTTYGYARVSSTDQDLAVQQAELHEVGCQVVRSEKVTGTTRNGREELQTLMDFLQSGDTLVVTRMDRLARSALDLLQIVKELEDRDVALKILKQNIDTRTSEGKLFLTMLAGFAEFETNLRRERQAEGIAKAKQEGRYKGGKKQIDRNEVASLLAQGINKRAISRQLGCNVKSIQRIAKELVL